MAEAVVSFVIEKLGDQLIQEAVSLYEVRDQVESIERELTRMQCFLKDADAKQKRDKRVKNWVRDIRDVAYDVEDIIDTFILKTTHQRKMRTKYCFLFFFKELVIRRQVAKEIEGIKIKIRDISASRTTYGIENIGGVEGTTSYVSDRLRERRRSSPHLDEPGVVGFNEDIKTLVARLLDQDTSRRCVISIVGMGGLGKTTLAKKVYNSNDVKRHFEICAWVYVSQEYRARELLHEMGKKVMGIGRESLAQMNKGDLEEKLSKILKKKRYLIVMDDIWKLQVWDDLKAVFPDGMNGSRVLFTTRIKDVALHADPRSPLHELHFLSDSESWELFSKRAFPMENDEIACIPELENLGRQIVARCGGLPLAIVILGGLLSRKEKTSSVWLRVLQSVSWQLTQDPDQLVEILALSYNDLPYYLKPCFLYFGLFPEDSEVPAGKLMLLWIAEGFVQQRDEESMEDVAEDLLEELIDRSMIQVAEKRFDGGIKTCRIHDLLRDLAISEGKECKFFDIAENMYGGTSTARTRRLTVHSNLSKYVSMSHSNPHLHSLLRISHTEESLRRDQWKFLCQSLKLLRVLDLECAIVRILPKEIGELIHLRYLGLRRTGLQRLPSSIGNLRNLQTLDMRSTKISRVPSEVWKMQQLRHLHLNKTSIMGRQPAHDSVRNLRTLSSVSIYGNSWIHDFLGKLTNLRKLGIEGYFMSQAEALSKSLVKLSSLRTLQLSGNDQILDPTLRLLLNHSKIYKFHLCGAIERLPHPQEFQPNLTKLSLEMSQLVQDPCVTLERLPNLRILRLLSNSYRGNEMVCSAGGFPKLHGLELEDLDKLEDWRVEEGAMPSLRRLVIQDCEVLKMLPEGLGDVITLRELLLLSMPDEFQARIREDDGDDWYKIQHIPSVVVT
ncbi:hypothetical protein HHK36_003447 [Tetracentron sinense]|uniref:Uncharacterized protein n=1 Tax=Tetracentron sinense TaxID=13715 RepID=A0A834ZSI9_TETSI|nr:hypothetical protein HHK36_003447 [Tetracentron sinense]